MPHQELNINFGSRVKMYLYTPKRGMPERELDCLNDTGDKNYQGIRGCSWSKSGGIKGVKPEPHKRNRRVHIIKSQYLMFYFLPEAIYSGKGPVEIAGILPSIFI